MPSHRVHRMLNSLLTGQEREDVNAWIDQPYAWLGPRHRILRHSVPEILARYHDDPTGLMAGLTHILTDALGSKDRALKKRLEVLALFRDLNGESLDDLPPDKLLAFMERLREVVMK